MGSGPALANQQSTVVIDSTKLKCFKAIQKVVITLRANVLARFSLLR